MHHYTAVMKYKVDWWIGWIAEVPGVNCQERSKEELTATLRITSAKPSNGIGKRRVRRLGRAMKKQASPSEATGVAAPSPCLRLHTGSGAKT
jgi:hypothetical protein